MVPFRFYFWTKVRSPVLPSKAAQTSMEMTGCCGAGLCSQRSCRRFNFPPKGVLALRGMRQLIFHLGQGYTRPATWNSRMQSTWELLGCTGISASHRLQDPAAEKGCAFTAQRSCGSPSLKVSKSRLDGAWWKEMIFTVLSNPKHSVIE